jgi:hypothetical protein
MSAAREQILNAALANLPVGAEYEDWLAMVDRFYAEHVQVSSDATSGRLTGRAGVKQALLNILTPLHAVMDADSTSVSLRCMPVHADRHDEYHSAWSLEIAAPPGRLATVRWCVRRIWRGGLVVHEHFYEHDMLGQALAVHDLWIPAPPAPSA